MKVRIKSCFHRFTEIELSHVETSAEPDMEQFVHFGILAKSAKMKNFTYCSINKEKDGISICSLYGHSLIFCHISKSDIEKIAELPVEVKYNSSNVPVDYAILKTREAVKRLSN